MVRSSTLWLAAAVAFACCDPLFADAKREEAFRLIALLTVVPLALYPLGLAWHLLALGVAPQRSAGLALDLQDHRWKTLLLGLANGAALLILTGVLGNRVPALSGICFLILLALVACGIHGAARALGEWILTRNGRSASSPFLALAVGWFVLVYASAIPVVGWAFGLYWITRGAGGVVLQVAGERAKG